MTISRYGPWRRAAAALEAVLLLGLPFVNINGRSALRFDVPSLSLHFFGTTIVMDEFFLVLLASLFMTFLLIAVTILFGRIWCGWACPQTVLSDLTSVLDRARGLKRMSMYIPVLALSALVSADLLWYFVSPYEFVRMIGQSPLVRWTFISLAMIIFIDLAFVRRVFCRTVCPYAKMQGVLFDDRTLLIAYDPAMRGECMDCAACRRACPVGLDIREGLDMNCIGCAGCIDACAEMRAHKGKGTLVDYHWGKPRAGRRKLLSAPFRVNAAIAIAGAISFGLLVAYMASTRPDFSAAIRFETMFSSSPDRASSDIVVNTYILSISNHTGRPQTYALSSVDARIVTREELSLPPGGAGGFKVYAVADERGGRPLPETIKIEIRAGDASKGEMLEIAFPHTREPVD